MGLIDNFGNWMLDWGMEHADQITGFHQKFNPFYKDFRLGKYKGDDTLLGSKKYGGEMKESAEAALTSFRERAQAGGGPRGRYGLGETLGDLGVDWDFDATDMESIAEALAKQSFEKDMQSQLDDPNFYESDLFETGSLTDEPIYGDISEEGYATVDPEWGADWAFDDWYDEERKGEFFDKARLGGITQKELGELDPGASKWRKMAAPLTAEATDIYREQLGSMLGGRGNIRTGSSARQRQELLENYGASMFDIKKGIRGKRAAHGRTLAERIAAAFGG